jgi:hypothetical protein
MPPTAHASRSSHSDPDDHQPPSTTTPGTGTPAVETPGFQVQPFDDPALDLEEVAPAERQQRSIPLFEANDIPAFFTPDQGPEEPEPEPVPDEFTVRPAHGLHGFLAGGAGLLAVGFAIAAARGGGFGAIWRWVVALGFAVLAAKAIRALLSKPLLVADGTGIRLRIQREWIGAPWEEIEAVTVLPRRHLLDDGRIAIHLSDPGPVVAAIARDANRATRNLTDTNRRLTGSSLAVPFGLAATPSHPSVVSALTALADDRCPVDEQP